jgi:crossover junction endodeoxyribonuclease RuvC
MEKIILGLDPGTATTGFGIISESGGQLQYIDCGHICTSKDKSPADRLLLISKSLDKLIKIYKPNLVAVESLFFAKNRTTAIAVAQARGVILCALAKHGLEFVEYTPLQVKQTLSGYGRADKQQIQRMVQSVLNLAKPPKLDDSADALALAICAAYSYKSVLNEKQV